MKSGSTPSVPDYYSDLLTPNIEDMKLQLEELVSQGTISPEDAQTVLLEQSQMNNISLDPKYKQAQLDALAQLQEIGSSGGLNAQSRARLAQIQNQEDAANRGNREALMNRFAAQGMGGSGIELAAQLQNQQDSAMRRSSRDLEVAALAEQQALDAIMKGGQLGGDLRNQDFNQQAQIAQANDAISRFNAQNRQDVINQNVAARNQAQAQNLANAQSLANQNVGLRNQAQIANKALPQQEFQNQMALRGGKSGIASQNAQAAGQNSANQAAAQNQMISTGIAALSPVAGAAYNQYTKEQEKKKPVAMKDGGLVHGDNIGYDSEPRMLMPGEMVVKKDDVPKTLKALHTNENGEFDIDGFLDQITGYKYGYKKGK